MAGRMIKLDLYDDMTVATLWRTDKPNSRVQVRGKPGYTGDGYDPTVIVTGKHIASLVLD